MLDSSSGGMMLQVSKTNRNTISHRRKPSASHPGGSFPLQPVRMTQAI
ncbi:hypothetical protein TGS27_1049 [Geobacillus stearothermophilus]|nr:hypothetical protein TGS27_1049 [Geobacillus stearothermophilus]